MKSMFKLNATKETLFPVNHLELAERKWMIVFSSSKKQFFILKIWQQIETFKIARNYFLENSSN